MHVLWVQTIVLSLAVAVVAVLRRPLGRRFGAEASYLCWAIPPLALLAASLPHRAHEGALLPPALVRLIPTWSATPEITSAAHGDAAASVAFAGWVLVATAMAMAIAWRQRRFRALLSDGQRLPAGSGPVVLGVVRPRVVLPVDFEQRFDETERCLMLAHEAVHQHRHDNAWNLLGCALLIVHWFNPLAWLAWRWMRFDQELSCDAAVLRDVLPGGDLHLVRVYAAALLKVQGVSLRPPLATSWRSTHPLVERVRMLNLHALSSAGRRSGRRLVALAVVLGGAVAYAAQPPAASRDESSWTTVERDFKMRMTVQVDGLQPGRSGSRPAKPSEDDPVILIQPDPKTGLTDWLSLHTTFKSLDDERVRIELTLRDDTTATLLAKPTVITRMNEPARVDVASPDGAHTYSVTFLATPSPTESVR